MPEICGETGTPPDRLSIRVQEGCRHPSGAGLQPCNWVIFRANGARGGGCSVLERTQHSCNITQRQVLAAPLGQGPHRLSLEVDDKYVVAGNENLAEI